MSRTESVSSARIPSGAESSRVESNGMEWSGVEWSGVESSRGERRGERLDDRSYSIFDAQEWWWWYGFRFVVRFRPDPSFSPSLSLFLRKRGKNAGEASAHRTGNGKRAEIIKDTGKKENSRFLPFP